MLIILIPRLLIQFQQFLFYKRKRNYSLKTLHLNSELATIKKLNPHAGVKSPVTKQTRTESSEGEGELQVPGNPLKQRGWSNPGELPILS